MAVAVAALTGWITGAPEKLDYLFSCYFQSEHSQSNLFLNKVASLPYQIQAFGNDQVSLRQVMQDSLQAMLSRYFDSVTVDVEVEPTPGDDGKLTVRVDVTVAQDGVTYSAGRAIDALANGKLLSIIHYNNEGTYR